MNSHLSDYWSSPWPAEDGGPLRLQTSEGVFDGILDGDPTVVSRDAHGATMVVLREPGEVFLHGHAVDERTTCWVEKIDPDTLEPLLRRDDLEGGARWPGGIAAHSSGSLIVIYGNHVHRLNVDLELLASRELPRDRPYNSFIVLPDGYLVTKDFGGALPGEIPDEAMPGAQLLVLDPLTLETVVAVDLPEPSIARLSAHGSDVYVVGNESLFRLTWNSSNLVLDDSFAPRYRTLDGQSYGWDAVIALGAAWFLDNGEGSQNYAGTFRGVGANTAPLHLVRVDLVTGAVSLTEICGAPNGVIANPPLIDERRMIAVGYDSGNGVLAAFDIGPDGSLEPRWLVEQNHACHLLLDPGTGRFLSFDHENQRWMEQFVVRDIASGEEILRLDNGSALQSVVFPAAGFQRTVYACSFSTISSLRW